MFLIEMTFSVFFRKETKKENQITEIPNNVKKKNQQFLVYKKQC